MELRTIRYFNFSLMKFSIYIPSLLVFHIFFVTDSFSQLIPTPQNFISVQPKWFHHVKDQDYIPIPDSGFSEYNSYNPQIFKVNKNSVYFYANSRLENFYGGFLLKLNGSNGNLNWRYASNHTNAPRPELYQEILFDENENPILSGGLSIKPYEVGDSPFKFGITPCQYSRKLLNRSTGQLINHTFSTDTTNHPLLNLGIISPVSYFTIHDKLYYRRFNSFRNTAFYPLKEDNLGVEFLDTAYFSNFLLDFDQWQNPRIPIETIEFIENNTFLKLQCMYFNSSLDPNQGILFKEHFKKDLSIEIEMINDDLGKYLKRQPSFTEKIPMYYFNDEYVFAQYYEFRSDSNPNTTLRRVMLLWLDADGKEKLYIPELKLDDHYYSSTLFPIGIFNEKLYIFAQSILYNKRGRDILEIDSGGNVRIVGNIINSDLSMSISVVYHGFTQNGDLICWALENKFNNAAQLIGRWSTIYSFDPIELGIPYTVSTKTHESKSKISISPNPTQDFLKIEIPDYSVHDVFYLTLYNSNGELVLQHELTSASEHIDILHITAGLYLSEIKSKSNKFIQTNKIVIIR